MKYQMTFFTFGAKWGLPTGGVHALSFAMPSRASIAPSANPVKPMPQSVRKLRRLTRPQLLNQFALIVW
jgi:hypothetical protein